ncbi:hypothetical protein GGI25_004893 [Coemansia spiralis]|uniref:Uncharacterized protein n=2 Tax=Coemansia TaxID=4863 RepID=A0A9W8G4S2_9FUNG|nr:hypothetical protein BX070DRAFT_249316 [Coemansia spiralis]KAJ1990830.1 hypothetical protein EDC05_003810 [Coemansia umbellata]KAJ2622616.1 hypothetical protein GGI26_003062 [Coemansia sp. RSA 1358]KAJ2672912.1 hypothetical protein GGI25_004893 [Coemansia spiralis]
MPRKEFPGDPRRADAVVPYIPATSGDGSLYYMAAFVSSMAALFSKSKWIGWVALFASLLSVFTDRQSAAGSSGGGSSKLSTVTLAMMSLSMTYLPELLALYRLSKGDAPAAGSAAGGQAQS